ncbi:hypothetical protein K3172_04055 [Qipengyuania sp. 6B39]|uniref:hypothetical protein n=1 Tax=Qipengyuania proteolytica TaxID=2867239 RepID=UPI001C89FAC4|nr:hypothetical protein [Qipengyuania proteolytica]MBX7495029.1 hypothetical protein [Qipengyuania proteolytica]
MRGQKRMGESELFGVIQDVSGLYATLMGMMITISFAMVAAVWSVLHRVGTGMKLAAFALYGVGMALLGSMMLQQAHLREQAVAAMRGLPGERSAFAAAFLETQQSGWFTLVWLFQHAAPWLLMAGVAWLLFAWKGREPR